MSLQTTQSVLRNIAYVASSAKEFLIGFVITLLVLAAAILPRMIQ